jgi:hypothetical protein
MLRRYIENGVASLASVASQRYARYGAVRPPGYADYMPLVATLLTGRARDDEDSNYEALPLLMLPRDFERHQAILKVSITTIRPATCVLYMCICRTTFLMLIRKIFMH